MIKYNVEKVSEGTFVIEQKALSSSCLSHLIVGKVKSLLIDTCIADPGFKKAVLPYVKGDLEVVNTHAHLDHLGNNHEFDKVFMCPKDEEVRKLHTSKDYLNKRLSEFPWIARLIFRKEIKSILDVHPEKEYFPVSEGHVFDLGGRLVEVIETPGHSSGSICLLERASGALYSGDTVCDTGILLHLDGSEKPETFLASIQKLLSLSSAFGTIWPGHRTRPLGKEILLEYEACAEAILNKSAKTERAKSKGTPYFTSSLGSVNITHF
jgi:glyoxylase-like metal-dependent hydrolase (beta-lactamase superfamily II)